MSDEALYELVNTGLPTGHITIELGMLRMFMASHHDHIELEDLTDPERLETLKARLAAEPHQTITYVKSGDLYNWIDQHELETCPDCGGELRLVQRKLMTKPPRYSRRRRCDACNEWKAPNQ